MPEKQKSPSSRAGSKRPNVRTVKIGPTEWEKIKNFLVFGPILVLLTSSTNKMFDHQGSHEAAELRNEASELRKEVGELRRRLNELETTHRDVQEGLSEQKWSVKQMEHDLVWFITGAVPFPRATSEFPAKPPAKQGKDHMLETYGLGAPGDDASPDAIGQAGFLEIVGDLRRQQRECRVAQEGLLERLSELEQQGRSHAKKLEGLEMDVNMTINTARRP